MMTMLEFVQHRDREEMDLENARNPKRDSGENID